MKRKNYDEVSVINSLSKNRAIKIFRHNNTVIINKNTGTVGNSTWGKIDYLCNYCGYTYSFVSDETTDLTVDDTKRKKKKSNKVDLLSSVNNIFV